jgi:serine O-acetyltransferase
VQFKEYRYLVLSDLYRIVGDVKLSALIRLVLIGDKYQYIFWMRTCQYARANPLLRIWFYPIARMMLRRYSYKYGISIPFTTQIGSGLYVGHIGGIVVNPGCVIGKNCNLYHGASLLEGGLGDDLGWPTIGDNTFIGPGAKVIGPVRIGNNVLIVANSVVVRDVPDNAVVWGPLGRVISYEGSKDNILNADYEDRLGHKELIDPDTIINNEIFYHRPTLGKTKPRSKDSGSKCNKLLALLLGLFTRLHRR